MVLGEGGVGRIPSHLSLFVKKVMASQQVQDVPTLRFFSILIGYEGLGSAALG